MQAFIFGRFAKLAIPRVKVYLNYFPRLVCFRRWRGATRRGDVIFKKKRLGVDTLHPVKGECRNEIPNEVSVLVPSCLSQASGLVQLVSPRWHPETFTRLVARRHYFGLSPTYRFKARASITVSRGVRGPGAGFYLST